MDTKSLKINVTKNLTRTRRKVIEDKLITPYIFDMIVAKVYASVDNIYNIEQKEVIKILLPMNLSNATIAKVVNFIVPNLKATSGSIASMIRFMNNAKHSEQQQLVDMLQRDLEKELNKDE